MSYVLILIGHFAGDYLLQPRRLAELKRDKVGYLLLHTVLYMLPVAAAMAFFKSWKVVLAFPVIAASHFLIDLIRQLALGKRSTPGRELAFFLIDQLLHMAVLLFIAYLFRFDEPVTWQYLLLCVVICTKPASVLVRYVLNALDCRIKQGRGEECEGDGGSAGAAIGILERLIMLIFGFMNLYSAIGLVFTAKSLARFKKFEERDFAEKYLVGTLLSMLIVILLLFIPKLLLPGILSDYTLPPFQQ